MRPSYAPKFKVSIKLHPSCEVGPYYYGIQCKENATAECRAAVVTIATFADSNGFGILKSHSRNSGIGRVSENFFIALSSLPNIDMGFRLRSFDQKLPVEQHQVKAGAVTGVLGRSDVPHKSLRTGSRYGR